MYIKTELNNSSSRLGSKKLVLQVVSHTLIPAPLPLLERVLEVLFSKRTKYILRFLLDLLHSVKAANL